MTTIWLDVEDLFRYARLRTRPTGIQRLSLELYAALHGLAPGRIGFFSRSRHSGEAVLVDWSHVDALYRRMGEAAAPPPARAQGPAAPSRLAALPVLGRPLYAAAQAIPPDLRAALGAAAYAQVDSLRHLGTFLRRAARRLRPAGDPALEAWEGADARLLADCVRPGDQLYALGAPWADPDYAARTGAFCRAHELGFGLLLYDLIPVVRPEFFDLALRRQFEHFLTSCLPLADRILAISQATAADTRGWAGRAGLTLRAEPEILPIGTGFRAPAATAPLPAGLQAGGYVLFVSTVEARKNHLLAFRAWRRLLDAVGPERLPKLVFAGRAGWMIADLMQGLENCAFLGGHVVLVEEASDAEIAALYRGARFTIFPSHYEGWGLPVSESLAFGKACIASSSTAIPEAGGPFCLYHDPEDVPAAAALYRRALEEPDLVAGLEARIREAWRPVGWDEAARAVLGPAGRDATRSSSEMG